MVEFLESATTKPPSEMRIITWNLDGLDDRNLKIRTKCVVKVLQTENPDVVFLQEVVPKTLDYLEKNLPPQFKFVPAASEGFVDLTLLLRDLIVVNLFLVLLKLTLFL